MAMKDWTKPDLKVVDFPINNLADIPARLRDLANDIEQEKYGSAQVCAVALESDTHFEVFGFGADGNTVYYLLACAQRKMENAFLKAKGIE